MPKVNIHEERPGTWRLQVRVNGQSFYRYQHGSRSIADTARQNWEAEIALKGPPRGSPTTPLRRWILECLKRDRSLRPNSLRAYTNQAEKHLLWLGNKPVKDITRTDFNSFLASHAELGTGETTIRQTYILIRSMLSKAADDGLISTNPFGDVKAPRRPRVNVPTPSPIQLGRLLSKSSNHDPRARILVLMAIASGARRSEMLALRWQDVDLRTGILAITAQLESAPGQPMGRAVLKTEESRRFLLLPSEFLPELKRARLLAAGIAHAADRPIDDLPIFPARDGLGWWHPNAAGQAAARFIAEHDIKATLHGLRHAHATALISGKVNPTNVSQRLGHSSVGVTLALYTHALPRDEEAAAALLNDLIAHAA